MARTDIFKRIKGDKLIESRIQKYRLHFDYLKTCLEHSKDFKVDKSKYTNWKLNLVSKYKFDKWWSQVGSSLFEKEIEQVKEVRTPRQSNTSTFVEIPIDTPTEYAIEKIRDIDDNQINIIPYLIEYLRDQDPSLNLSPRTIKKSLLIRLFMPVSEVITPPIL